MPPYVEPKEHLKEVNEELYKRNVDLAVRNKTLSLLRELYQIGILTLEPKLLAEKLARTVQQAFAFELVEILFLDQGNKALIPLGFAESEKLTGVIKNGRFVLSNLTIPNAPKHQFFGPVINHQLMQQTTSLNMIWWQLVPSSALEEIEAGGHIRDSLAYPLIIGDKVIGALLLSVNRTYGELSQFERESIESFVNTIAIALDKSILYQQIQIANDKLRELDRQKTEFVSIASHQLRSPLTAIKGYSSMLIEGSFGQLNEKAKEATERIFESSQRLVIVIEDFLNITRIELGKMKYELVDFSLADLVKKMVDDMTPTIQKKGLAISYEAIGPGPFVVNADTGKISQVVSNIIDNAAKYTPHGSIKVSLNRLGDNVQLKVTDTGVGIPPETIPKLFEKYVRADSAGQVNYIGTGLGLYVARQIIEAHGGKIWAESPGPDHGSTFIVELKGK